MIQSINEQADAVAERHRRYGAEDIVASRLAATSTVDPRLAAMYEEVTQLVGIEKPSAEIISLLSAQQRDGVSNMKTRMVSIVGVGGLGKTTLAKVVYDKLKVDFPHTAFVLVGQNPDLKKVFRDLLIDLDKKKYMDPKWTMLDEKQLIDELREYLSDKRYFIVIDDIWETKSWKIMKLALVDNKCGSRVITTTSKLEVARNVGDVYYKLERLAYDKSKKLFYTRIFGATEKCPDNQLDEISDKILKKCDGVPLAISTMASLSVGKSREEWIEVCNAIIFRDKYNKQVSDTEWILSLSYYDLPAHLKTCLLYLSAIPEDYVIDKDTLIWKWIAEGFVNDKPGTWLYEVGEGYFNKLINRSMIQAVSPKANSVID
ncbi:hypothetical protein PR202_gb20518 [Eleusine coracana subsp. coracana]|uniref:NB-ARC domain-containing protein n=1 Tax=Eleusine coracana subsp. coracana TaxID=191504 RepID=A0AAV5FBN3_ELECO|nr:hypothetical protein PR202_gb20518 [Eleusine coracana subsp. coracana]